jgi:tyrosyl-DNA phosphodiesterase-1
MKGGVFIGTIHRYITCSRTNNRYLCKIDWVKSVPVAMAGLNQKRDFGFNETYVDLTKEDSDDDSSIKRLKVESKVQLSDSPFQLLKTRGIPPWANSGQLGVDFEKLVAGDIKVAFVSNYMIDVSWLVSTFPDLLFSDKLIIAHGMKGQSMQMKSQLLRLGVPSSAFEIYCPYVPAYGTHHSKAFFLQYSKGIRIIIHTANLVYCDFNNKSQSAFIQDFPLKSATGTTSTSDFEEELIQYVEKLGLQRDTTNQMKTIISLHDYSFARAKIVASVPSKPFEFHGNDMRKFGQARVGAILELETFPKKFSNAPVIAQFSSIGNLSGKFVNSILDNFCSGICDRSSESSKAAGSKNAELQLIWPTVAEVRDSLEGWFGGGSICGYPERVNKPIVVSRLHQWGGGRAGRQRAMPHMKTYLRYQVDTSADSEIPQVEIAWIILTSHNFSKAAWGEEVQSQKYNARLFRILSYELGVVLLPRLEVAYRNSPYFGFSCTSTVAPPKLPQVDRVQFIPWERHSCEEEYQIDGTLRIPIPLPFDLPPKTYCTSSQDAQGYDVVPWSLMNPDKSNPEWNGIDSLGNQFPGRGSYSGVLQRGTAEDHWQQLFSG